MNIVVRPLPASEAGLVVAYFHDATDQHLQLIGVDRQLLPSRAKWLAFFEPELLLAPEQRRNFFLLWEFEGVPVGFSSADRIKVGEEAFMHLHLFETSDRSKGLGSEALTKSVERYFEIFKLKRLFCEPNAYNLAPNRTLQKVGFKYLKTYDTVPGPLNFHQAVNQWVFYENPN